ncbi:alpha/beta hydrolase [Couchioplanes caeruleus]|uniref:S-formylglutathione hydrolase FrmB n=1 Tax=Couchioplanes caeruleus TaxID=56438 RepID=A0A3N1GFF1_9ACTN|nr:alpha/beta fold hydrolase [Couchioplanes caeruleus]ROP28861.1 S-formylglutathione hydrolase FrmB [Couchioplanes caeruleus]
MSDIVITSGWVVAVVIGLTVVAAVVTAKFWDRGRFRTVHRAIGLLVVQLLVLLSIGTVVNRGANFYVTLGELFGQGKEDGYAASIPPQAPTLSADGTGEDGVARWIADHPTKPGKGTVIPAMLTGARTGYSLPAQIYLPAGYASAPATQKFPVVLFLAGYPGTHYSWSKSMGVPAALDQAISAKHLAPVIGVLAEHDPIRGRDSECVDSAHGVRADTYLTSDLPDVVSRHFRAASGRQNWSVVGYSTGGFCAANMALRHPDKFSAAGVLSGYFRPIIDRSTGDLYKDDLNLRRANDPRLLIGQRRPAPTHFFLFAGTGDREALKELKAFAPLVHAPDTLQVVDDRPGGHNFAAWKGVLPDLFAWLNRTLTAGAGRDDKTPARLSPPQ